MVTMIKHITLMMINFLLLASLAFRINFMHHCTSSNEKFVVETNLDTHLNEIRKSVLLKYKTDRQTISVCLD